MKTEETYYYCTVHKKSLLKEDITKHQTNQCNFIIKEFNWTPPKRKAKPWMARTIVDKEKMVIYKLPKTRRTVSGPLLPDDAILIDSPSFQPKEI